MSEKTIGGLIVLFGGTGDLAESAILPAFYHLYQQGRISKQFAIIGASRQELSDEEYRKFAREAIGEEAVEEEFFQHLFFQSADNTELADFEQLSISIQEAAREFQVEDSYIYYYSIPPSLYDETTKNLKKSGILDLDGTHRVVVEKPFGEDESTAEEYFDLLKKAFNDEQIYLVDHFLGMSSVQNILATRFYNPAMEAIWNRQYIEQIQISVPENFSIGTRGTFYDANGALLDMFQNHLLQTLATVTMDLPAELSAAALNKQKLALLQQIPSFTAEEVEHYVVRGQYDAYREEEDVPGDSNTETYIAIQLKIDSERWQGVPIYVRTGKSMEEGPSVVDVLLKNPVHTTFEKQNQITFSLADGEGISFVMNQLDPSTEKDPLPTRLGPDEQTFQSLNIPDAYENLLYDVLQGNETHFTTFAQVKEQWRITDSIKKGWSERAEPDFPNYTTGEKGPKEAEELLAKNGHQWLYR